jgi:hypothetical protein
MSARATATLQRKCACSQHTAGGEQCEECKKKATLQRQAASGPGPVVAPPIVHEVLRSPGQPLDRATRSFMEPRFGHDFSGVRVHSDAKAAESARAVSALAYTVGRNVVFGAELRTQQPQGQHVLAHELAHVVQQHSGSMVADSQEDLRIGGAGDPQESEADRVANSVLAGDSQVGSAGPGDHNFRAGSSRVLRRYGHANSCKEDEHLKPFVWPGHDYAKKAVKSAIDKLTKSPLDPDVAKHLVTLFGKDAASTPNVATILGKFQAVSSALDGNYLYHCANPCEKPNQAARAWTDPSGNRDITLCFNKVKDFGVSAAAWIIIHENIHRGLNIWPAPHPWEPKGFDECIGYTQMSTTFTAPLVLDSPDSYACFAIRVSVLP